MNVIIQSTLKTLEKSKNLLDSLTDENLCNNTISPYYSSIGSHIRHILDFYDCIFNVNFQNAIDLTARNRSRTVETECRYAKEYLNSIIERLEGFDKEINNRVTVIDDLGLGKVEIMYTYAALFSQANSHTIHHYAIINYILDALNISIKDSDFGYNPATPKEIPLN